MNPPKKKINYTTKNGTEVSIKAGNNKKVIKTKRVTSSGAKEKTKSVTKYGSRGSVTREKSKFGSSPTTRKVQGSSSKPQEFDRSVSDKTKFTKTGLGSAIAAKKMMKKYK
jgi:hypothetical protein